ncbi:hypothetical protein HanRHA438_Chr06g0259001 [Helianthus annuus]|nr:hypothetical protein HanRHA438_Chr06g0259001 [Helianthus annuus]
MNAIERTRQLFVFVHLTNRTEFLVHVRSLTKRTNVNELPSERFMNCSLNVRFVYSPTYNCYVISIEQNLVKLCNPTPLGCDFTATNRCH